MIRTAVIGAGYWGPNLIRNFAACPLTQLVAVCDKDQGRLAKVLAGYPDVEAVELVEKLLQRDDVDAVAIATPVSTHAPIGIAALRAGKHVLVEKPMARSVREAEELVEAAEQAGRTLMVDHTFIYSGPVRKMKEIIDSGELGQLYYLDSVRINLGLFQHDVNVGLGPRAARPVDHGLSHRPPAQEPVGLRHLPYRSRRV